MHTADALQHAVRFLEGKADDCATCRSPEAEAAYRAAVRLIQAMAERAEST